MEIEVSVAFFSVGVKIEVEKKFAGSNGDPTFEQVMRPYFLVPQLPEDLQNPQGDLPQDPWDDYTSAFAFVA